MNSYTEASQTTGKNSYSRLVTLLTKQLPWCLQSCAFSLAPCLSNQERYLHAHLLQHIFYQDGIRASQLDSGRTCGQFLPEALAEFSELKLVLSNDLVSSSPSSQASHTKYMLSEPAVMANASDAILQICSCSYRSRHMWKILKFGQVYLQALTSFIQYPINASFDPC